MFHHFLEALLLDHHHSRMAVSDRSSHALRVLSRDYAVTRWVCPILLLLSVLCSLSLLCVCRLLCILGLLSVLGLLGVLSLLCILGLLCRGLLCCSLLSRHRLLLGIDGRLLTRYSCLLLRHLLLLSDDGSLLRIRGRGTGFRGAKSNGSRVRRRRSKSNGSSAWRSGTEPKPPHLSL